MRQVKDDIYVNFQMASLAAELFKGIQVWESNVHTMTPSG
jgi:hypothetical protein